MPELPEVETTVRQLRHYYLHKRIVKVEAKPVKIFREISPEEFVRFLENRKILAIERHGKFFYWNAEGVFPVFHLGMSGIFIRQKAQSKYPQHLHLAFYFEDGSELYFQDARKFGKISLLQEKPQFEELGPDPLKENFTLNRFKQLLHSKSINIKALLMNQRTIAGIGNIYASEILFRAGIHPLRKANSLDSGTAQKLHRSILTILQDAVERFGTTYSAYRTVEGSTGANQNFLKVYQRHGQPCFTCGKPIQKTLINNRSTFFCDHCQE